jgi:hypothetical protein
MSRIIKRLIQYAGKIATAVRTKWKFIAEPEDEETREID